MGACPLRRSLPDIVARDEDVISLLVEWLIRDKVSKMSREKFKGWASLPVFWAYLSSGIQSRMGDFSLGRGIY
jgi:hypothetical protein